MVDSVHRFEVGDNCLGDNWRNELPLSPTQPAPLPPLLSHPTLSVQ